LAYINALSKFILFIKIGYIQRICPILFCGSIRRNLDSTNPAKKSENRLPKPQKGAEVKGIEKLSRNHPEKGRGVEIRATMLSKKKMTKG
jgi:hypothetical protein